MMVSEAKGSRGKAVQDQHLLHGACSLPFVENGPMVEPTNCHNRSPERRGICLNFYGESREERRRWFWNRFA